MVEVRLAKVQVSETSDRQYVFLEVVDGYANEAGEKITLPIVIGYREAQAIDRFLSGPPPERPLTHNLAVSLIHALGGIVERVQVTELNQGTYYALVRLVKEDRSVVELDARPSDAIALATALGAPIYVNEEVLETSGQ